jgi:hypothetical protein
VRLKVRGTGNADYRRLHGKKTRKIAAQRLGPEKEQAAEWQMTNELLVETILLDWDGLSMDNKALPYTPEIAAQFLADPEMRFLRDAVIYAGNLVATRKKGAGDEAEKN